MPRGAELAAAAANSRIEDDAVSRLQAGVVREILDHDARGIAAGNERKRKAKSRYAPANPEIDVVDGCGMNFNDSFARSGLGIRSVFIAKNVRAAVFVNPNGFHDVAIMTSSNMDINGKVALITGSSKRIGRETALALAARGALVAVHYRSDEAGARETLRLIEQAGSSGHLFRAELTDPSDVDAMFEAIDARFERLDILVNNASIFNESTVRGTGQEEWSAELESNAAAPFFVAQRAAQRMSSQEIGKIVNLVDVAGEVIWPGYFAYSVSKAALIAVNRGLAKALAPGIQVNGVAPGPVLFPEYYTEEQKSSAVERTLLKRAGTARDVVNAILFFIENDYVTGEIIHVDGGRHIM